MEFQKIEKNFAELHSKLIITVFTCVFLEPKNKFFLFLGKNFLENLHYGYTKKLSSTFFDLSFGTMYKSKEGFF